MKQNINRPALRKFTVRRLIHITPDLGVNSRALFILELIQALDQYQHTVVVLSPPEYVHETVAWSFQAAGADTLYTDRYVNVKNANTYAAAILYDADPNKVELPPDVPTVYYSYYAEHDTSMYGLTLYPSKYAVNHNVRGVSIWRKHADHDVVLPGIRSRMIRGLAKEDGDKPFSVGIFSGQHLGKYPANAVMQLARRLPDDIRIITTASESLNVMGSSTKVWTVPIMVDSTLRGIQLSDVILYIKDDNYYTPYGRTCIEALAARKPVICQRKGALVELFDDNVHVLMCDTLDEATNKILYLRDNPDTAEQLAANGHVLASRQDITVCAGEIKGILQSFGA